MYDHDPGDVALLGWEEFIARQWASIFSAHRSWAGLRRIGRRWADLLEVGLGCSQDLADHLVEQEIINGPDRILGPADPDAVLAGMAGVLAAVKDNLAELGRSGELEREELARLLDQHARLAAAVGAADQAPGS